MSKKGFGKIWKVPIEEFKEIVQSSFSYTECLKRIGSIVVGNSFYSIKNRIIYEDINIDHFDPHKNPVDRSKISSHFLVQKSTMGTSGIKKRILKENLLDYKCKECGLESEWNGKLISLHLDHINGVNNDNRLENLRFLCPNCHSQTETYCGKKHKNKKR